MKNNILISAVMIFLWSSACLAKSVWLGEYTIVPNEHTQQVYDDGASMVAVSVTQLQDGLGLTAHLVSQQIEPAIVERTGEKFREFLEMANLEHSDMKIDTLASENYSVFRIPKGSQFKTLDGETRTMMGDYLFVAHRGMIVLDLRKKSHK